MFILCNMFICIILNCFINIISLACDTLINVKKCSNILNIEIGKLHFFSAFDRRCYVRKELYSCVGFGYLKSGGIYVKLRPK